MGCWCCFICDLLDIIFETKEESYRKGFEKLEGRWNRYIEFSGKRDFLLIGSGTYWMKGYIWPRYICWQDWSVERTKYWTIRKKNFNGTIAPKFHVNEDSSKTPFELLYFPTPRFQIQPDSQKLYILNLDKYFNAKSYNYMKLKIWTWKSSALHYFFIDSMLSNHQLNFIRFLSIPIGSQIVRNR